MIWFNMPDLLPPIYRLVKALNAAAESENELFQRILDAFDHVKGNFYFQTCDLYTLEIWENLLGIYPYDGETKEERRNAVIMFLNNQEPYTVRFLKRNLTQYLGAENEKWSLQVIPENYTLNIFYLDVNQKAQDQMSALASRIKPAHINLNVGTSVRAESKNLISLYSSSDNSTKVVCSAPDMNSSVYDASTQTLYSSFDNPIEQTISYNGLVQTYDEFYHVEPQTNGFIYDPSSDTLTPAYYDDEAETVTWEREQTEAFVLCYSNEAGAPATMATGRCIVVKQEDADLLRSWGIEIEPVEGLGGAILWHPSWREDYTEEDYAGGSFISKMYADKEGTNVVIGWEETGRYPYQYGFSLGKIYTRLMISGGTWGEYPPLEYRSFLLYIKKPNT